MQTIPEKTMAAASSFPVARIIQAWLMIGLFMIFMQVVIGGITRLTGSGLSITKWEIVTGTLPPLGANQWEEAFDPVSYTHLTLPTTPYV